jgi:hypothetical protein
MGREPYKYADQRKVFEILYPKVLGHLKTNCVCIFLTLASPYIFIQFKKLTN